jgi:hypothetical protein
LSGCRALDWIDEARLLHLALFMLIALVVSGGQIAPRNGSKEPPARLTS